MQLVSIENIESIYGHHQCDISNKDDGPKLLHLIRFWQRDKGTFMLSTRWSLNISDALKAQLLSIPNTQLKLWEGCYHISLDNAAGSCCYRTVKNSSSN